jgi:hypothetical protein
VLPAAAEVEEGEDRPERFPSVPAGDGPGDALLGERELGEDEADFVDRPRGEGLEYRSSASFTQHESHTRTSFRSYPSRGMVMRLAEQLWQKISPHARQWCRLLTTVKLRTQSTHSSRSSSGTHLGRAAMSRSTSACTSAFVWIDDEDDDVD